MPEERNGTPATIALEVNATKNIIQIFDRHRHTAFHLSRPIDLSVRHEHGQCIITYPPLDLEVWGDNEMEALWAFAELFSDTWHSVANAPDSGLTGDARELKRQMRELVGRTEPVKAA